MFHPWCLKRFWIRLCRKCVCVLLRHSDFCGLLWKLKAEVLREHPFFVSKKFLFWGFWIHFWQCSECTSLIKRGTDGGTFLWTLRSFRNTFFIEYLRWLLPANLLKKRLRDKYFPVNFAKFLRNPFFKNTSGSCLCGFFKSLQITLTDLLIFAHFAWFSRVFFPSTHSRMHCEMSHIF